MDESKTGIARRRHASKAPIVEALEGRRLMAAALSQPGIKEVARQGYTELDVVGTNKGGSITIDDNGSNAVGNISITLANGTSYTSKGAISVIKVQDGSGTDKVTYNLNGPLTAPESVLFNLGAGNDRFTANINGAVNAANGLDLEVFGGAGNDNLVVNQNGPTQAGSFVPYLEGDDGNDTLTYRGTGNIWTGASVTPEFAGGAGNDTIKATYSGEIDGNYIYNLSADGGAGNDSITENVFVAAGSTGSVGTSPATPAAALGGSGNDTIRFAVTVDPSVALAQVNAVVVGGAGKDTASRTSNVLGDKTNEKDITLA
jgi:hypothetical protein